jgi:hypothetical protein
MLVAGSPKQTSRTSWDRGVLAFGDRAIELLSGDETVCDAEVAVHDGDVGGLQAEGASGRAMDEGVEAGTEVVVLDDELAGLLISGGSEGAAASVADTGGAVPVPGGVVVDLTPGELDDGAGIVEAVEVADESEDECTIEGIAAGDTVES